MTEWEPATEAEVAMRDALRASDQELYFRILARTELLLPVSVEALAGQVPMGWGTWTTGGRTHVLAFTSAAALRACLGENGGSSRRSTYHDLAAGWPNHEWWLAVNPGLPIEGYLPAWFVSQLSRGDVRLPGRTLGARARLERSEQVARTRSDSAPPPAPPRPPSVASPPRRDPVEPSRDATEALLLPPADDVRVGSPAPGTTEVASAWLVNPRRHPLAKPSRPAATSATDGRPGAVGSSFFEPTPGRSTNPPPPISPLRSQDRAAPSSRLGEPGRAFPRRRPYQPDPPGEERTQPFHFHDPAPAERLTPPGAPAQSPAGPAAPVTEPIQPLPRRKPRPDASAGEPTQALPRRLPPPSMGEPTQALPRRAPQRGSVPAEPERTEPIPRPEPPAGPADYRSVAESPAPPGFDSSTAPVVIEGIVVSREAGGADPPDAEPQPATASDDPVSSQPAPPDFRCANDVEADLLGAAGTGSTDTFLSTLLLARVLLPVATASVPGARPGDSGFVWHTEQLDGETYVVVYTSPERLADRLDTVVETAPVRFLHLIRAWPDPRWSFAVNPGTPIGAKLPGEQIVALANWAAEFGLGEEREPEPTEPPTTEQPVRPTRHPTTPDDPHRPPMMQKAVAPSQLAYYLERGYDRVSGFVHRAAEVAHLDTPAKLYAALGLGYPDSPFSPHADEIYVLRWPAYRPSLYRIPYGGQNESAMRAMEGWVIERPPFRGNGFAPGESSDVVAEFKVDSARLPNGAQLWRISADGSEQVVAILDTDSLLWRQVGER